MKCIHLFLENFFLKFSNEKLAEWLKVLVLDRNIYTVFSPIIWHNTSHHLLFCIIFYQHGLDSQPPKFYSVYIPFI